MKYTLLLLVFLFSFMGCNLLTDSSSNPTETRKTITSDGVEYSLDIHKTVYSITDTLNISFKVENNSVAVKEFHFRNIQQLTFQLVDKYNNVVMSYPNIVSPALSSFTLSPGELSASSLFKHSSGSFISKDNHTLTVFLADNNSPILNLQIVVN